jgi:hypothetical protein
MAIPLIGNVGFTEVSSSGTLNDKAGTAKSKLPVQYFRLTGNISGNLTLNNDSAHKKIILDTNGNTITNSSGSPLTTNSSTTLELLGSGNVQSTLKTFTSSVSSTSNTGTTTISEADNSTMAVTTTTTDTTTTASVDRTFFQFASAFGSNVPVVNVTWNDSDVPSVMQNANSSLNGGGNFASGTLFVGTTSTSTSSAPSGNTISLPRSCGSQTSLVNAGVPHVHSTPVFYQNCASGNPWQFYYVRQGETGISGSVRIWLRFPATQNNRVLTFTNNLAISCVLSGADPYDDVTVSAGSTAVVTRSDSTDGSFSLTGTISGSNGSSQPFALSPVNSGSGIVSVSDYTGTLSASAL